jgi:hypothetical protein
LIGSLLRRIGSVELSVSRRFVVDDRAEFGEKALGYVFGEVFPDDHLQTTFEIEAPQTLAAFIEVSLDALGCGGLELLV